MKIKVSDLIEHRFLILLISLKKNTFKISFWEIEFVNLENSSATKGEICSDVGD